MRVHKSDKTPIQALLRPEDEEEMYTEKRGAEFTCVMKFGGSSLASADRIREIANLILSFPDENPVIVLSAMGKTTNNLLLVMLVDFLQVFLPFFPSFFLYFIHLGLGVSDCIGW